MDSLIKLEDISFSYKKKNIYNHMNVEINRGDILAVLGHNGAGKTTLLNIMAGLLKTDKGNIHKESKNLTVGYMNEALGLYPYLSGKENLRLFFLRNGINCSDKELEELLLSIKIKDDDKVKNYSTGMKRKLSLLGTLVSRAELNLLDEPFTGIDPVSLEIMIERIKASSTRDNAFVIVNHDLASTKKLCNRFVIIKDGEIVFASDKKEDIDNLEEIYLRYSE